MAWVAGVLDFRVTRGALWTETLRYRHSDRSPVAYEPDCVAHMQIRTMQTRDGTSADGLVLELASPAMGIVGAIPILLDPLTGGIQWTVDEDDTMLLNPENVRTVRYAYSLRLNGTMFGGWRPLVRGTVEMLPEVIR